MVHQLKLEVPDEVYQPLLQQAQATGQTVEAVAQACLAQALQSPAPGSRLRRWVGAHASQVPDTSIRHDEYLGQALFAPKGV
jgi:hypothetical protein